MNKLAIQCTVSTAIFMTCLFYGYLVVAAIFGIFLLFQLIGAVGDPDNKKATSAGNTDGNK